MTYPKYTKLGIREDKAASIASSMRGANINAVGFNLVFIALRNPKLALEIMKLFAKASKMKEDDSPAPDEDYELVIKEFRKLIDKV